MRDRTEDAIMLAVVGRDALVELGEEVFGDPYPDRIAMQAITVCVVCGRPVEPKTDRECETCDALGVHEGECFRQMKREAGRVEARATRGLLLYDECEPFESAHFDAIMRGRS